MSYFERRVCEMRHTWDKLARFRALANSHYRPVPRCRWRDEFLRVEDRAQVRSDGRHATQHAEAEPG